MTIVALMVPDDLGAALHVPAERLGAEIALAAAVRLFEDARVSLAKAAEIAGLDRFSFAEILSSRGIPTAIFASADVESADPATR